MFDDLDIEHLYRMLYNQYIWLTQQEKTHSDLAFDEYLKIALMVRLNEMYYCNGRV